MRGSTKAKRVSDVVETSTKHVVTESLPVKGILYMRPVPSLITKGQKVSEHWFKCPHCGHKEPQAACKRDKVPLNVLFLWDVWQRCGGCGLQWRGEHGKTILCRLEIKG